MSVRSMICIVCMLMVGMTVRGQALSEKEQEFTDKLSVMLDGVKVTMQKKAPGYKIDIGNLKIDTAREARSWLFAGSMPALFFLKDSLRESAVFKYIDVHVKAPNGKEIQNRFSFRQLGEVEACLRVASRYSNGLITTNADSIASYSEADLVTKMPPAGLVEKLKAADQAWGRVEDMNINGFRIEAVNGKETIYVSIYLARNIGNQLVEMWINPVTRKVVKIDI